MERIGQFQQAPAQRVEKEPANQYAPDALRGPSHGCQAPVLRDAFAGQFPQAGSADHLVFVFRDAFPTIELPATRTAGHGFAPLMIEATLINEFWHD
jgi:hypothetical protein